VLSVRRPPGRRERRPRLALRGIKKQRSNISLEMVRRPLELQRTGLAMPGAAKEGARRGGEEKTRENKVRNQLGTPSNKLATSAWQFLDGGKEKRNDQRGKVKRENEQSGAGKGGLSEACKRNDTSRGSVTSFWNLRAASTRST